MGFIHYNISFQGDLPAVDTVLERLDLLTGLEVIYDEAKTILYCAKLEIGFGLYPGDNNDYYITSFDMDFGRSRYFEQATIHALQTLGGTYADEVSPWAKEPWDIAKKHF